jgi:hypothetical protein
MSKLMASNNRELIVKAIKSPSQQYLKKIILLIIDLTERIKNIRAALNPL